MPYEVKKEGDRYAIVNKQTQKTVGHSDSKSSADASVRARYAGEWKRR